MLVTDRALCAVPDDARGASVSAASKQGGEAGLIAAVETAVQGGVDAIQLREKDLESDDLSALARRLRQTTLGQALLLVNGPLDVALAVEADGVHLPEDAPPVRRPREGFLIGRSVHSVEAARRAEAEGVDYLIAGPAYETPSHPDREPAGLLLIEEVAAAVSVPVLAIGGVNEGRVEEVLRAGASGVAVISAVLGRPDRRAAASELRRALDAAWVGVGAARS